MNIEALWSATPPWLHVVVGDATLADALAADLRVEGKGASVIALLRGGAMTTFAELFDEFRLVLRFPPHFGRNFNALYDSITDLSWLPAHGYVLIITDASLVLSRENPGDAIALIRLLQRGCEAWNHAVDDGEAWDRPAVPFHVVFQVSSQAADAFRLTLSAADAAPHNVLTR